MADSLVSIALCTYNSGSYLTILLESLLKQTYSNIEILCCDDKSTDGTTATLLAYQEKHPEIIKLHFNENNIGYTRNFEQAISLCKGDYIAIADHDDIWIEHKVEKLKNAIGDAMLVYSDSIYIDKDGNETGRRLTTKFNLHDKPDPRSFVFASSVWGHTILFNKKLLATALPIPANAPYDTWLAYVAASISEVRYLPEALTYWRQHSASYSTQFFAGGGKNANLKYTDWKRNMLWLQAMKDLPQSNQSQFLQKLYTLYQKKQSYSFVFGLYFFLVANRKSLFKVWRRSYLSSLNEFRKMATGVKDREVIR